MIYLYEEKNRLIFFNIYSRGQGGTEMALQRKYNSEFFFSARFIWLRFVLHRLKIKKTSFGILEGHQ